jgi:hypothetical protein
MELFVVSDKGTGKVVGNGFENKVAAKLERDRLQTQHGGGLPKPEERQDPTKWSYKIGRGKDHFRMAPRKL